MAAIPDGWHLGIWVNGVNVKPAEQFVENWLPLKFYNHLANTVEDIDRNIEYALSRNFTPLQALIGTKSGAVAIVGSGPSLKETWQELRRFKGDIMACNASCQFLLARGIVPTYMMCFDADPLMLEFILWMSCEKNLFVHLLGSFMARTIP